MLKQFTTTEIFKFCQRLFPEWQTLSQDDFDFDAPKGFSSFTMGIRSKVDVSPNAVLFRKLDGKENAILDFEIEKEVFLNLSGHKLAAQCFYYDESCRIESFYPGRSLTAGDLFQPEILKKIATQLYQFHQLTPSKLPTDNFFQLLHQKWGQLAKIVLEEKLDLFPENEQVMCKELRLIYSRDIREKVKKALPSSDLTFCHNDTYHGNIMLLNTGDIKLVDFEFSCLNHKAYDFSNLFAETVMQHQLSDYPYFKINEPDFNEDHLSLLIGYYLDNQQFSNSACREAEHQKLLEETKIMLKFSDYKYAMAAITLAINPIQKIRFIPYAYERFTKFLTSLEN